MRIALALVLALAGCTAVQLNPVDAIVAETMTAARAPAAEQAAALARAEKDVTRTGGGTPADRLRLGSLLATLPPPLRDDPRAAELLGPLADPNAPGIGRFAALLAAQVAERQRVERDLERVSRELERVWRELERVSREAERAARERERLDKERATLDKERERVDKERDKREEALKQQLEALRAIERGILEREEKMRRKQK
jgi:hypothetical protein